VVKGGVSIGGDLVNLNPDTDVLSTSVQINVCNSSNPQSFRGVVLYEICREIS
jgi:hypothetical protein